MLSRYGSHCHQLSSKLRWFFPYWRQASVGRKWCSTLTLDDLKAEEFNEGEAENLRRLGDFEKQAEKKMSVADLHENEEGLSWCLEIASGYVKNYSLDKADSALKLALGPSLKLGIPYNIMALQSLATLRFKQHRFQDCADALHQVEDIGIEHPATYVNLGTAYNAMRRYDRAAYYFEKSILLKDGIMDGDDKWNMGLVKKNLGQFDEAQPLLEEALEFHYQTTPDDKVMIAKVHDSCGSLYKDMKDHDLAESHYKKAYELFKGALGMTTLTGGAAGELGKALIVLGRVDEGERYLIEAFGVEASKDGVHLTPLYELLHEVFELSERLGDKRAEALIALHDNIESSLFNLARREFDKDGNFAIYARLVGRVYLFSGSPFLKRSRSLLEVAYRLLKLEIDQMEEGDLKSNLNTQLLTLMIELDVVKSLSEGKQFGKEV